MRYGAYSVVGALSRMANAKRLGIGRQTELQMIAGDYLTSWTGEKGEERWDVVVRNAESFDVSEDMSALNISIA